MKFINNDEILNQEFVCVFFEEEILIIELKNVEIWKDFDNIM